MVENKVRKESKGGPACLLLQQATRT